MALFEYYVPYSFNKMRHESMWCNSSSIPRAGSVDFFVQIWWLWRLYIHWVSPNCANMNAVSAAAVDLCIPLIVSHTIQDREIGGYNFLSSNEKSQRVYYCTDRPNASSQVNICPPCRSRHAIPAIASCTIRRIKFFIVQWKISKNCDYKDRPNASSIVCETEHKNSPP